MIGINNSFSYGMYGGQYSGYGSSLGYGSIGGLGGNTGSSAINGSDPREEALKRLPGAEDEDEKKGRKIKGKGDGPNGECETCKERKYQDGSDEMVSFKSAAHVDPGAAASAVRSHEQEHVSNAYKKASGNNGKVINASVTIKTDVCPECGRTYVSGGTTNTQIKYYNEDNPYQQSLKSGDRAKYTGRNADYAV